MRKIISFLLVIMFTLLNMCNIPVYAAYITTNDGYTVANYAKTAVDTHEMSRRGLCQTFAWECLYNTLRVSNKLGCGCCATNAWQAYGVSTSRDNIPLGAAVYFGGSSTICNCGQEAGHVGIYIGNDEIAHAWSSTIICKTTIDYVINCGYYYRGWGWQGGYALAIESVPEIPTIKSINANNETSISIKWNSVSGATSYRVRRRKSGDEDYVTAGDVAATTTSFTDTGLEPGTKYFYKIFAVNSAGSSDGSERAEMMTLCEAPVVTKVKAVSTSSISIKWNKVKGASSYRVRRRKSGEEDYVTAAESVTTTSFTDTGLEPETKYFYKIFAVNEGGSSIGSERVEMYPMLTLKIDPQGGTRKETTDILTAEFEYGETKKLSAPTKEGYKFLGWALDFKGDGHINGYWGTPIHDDPIFEKSYDSISVYDKSGNDTVVIKRKTRESACGIKGTYMLKIATTGTAKPGLGGFRQLTDSKSGGIFYHVIYAKIPEGYTIEQANNECGDNAKFEWLTSKEGTGGWEPYVYKVTCGTSGTFSTFGHIYLSGPAATEEAPVKWSVGYSEVFDATDVNMTDNMYTMGGGNAIAYALWEKEKLPANTVVKKYGNKYDIYVENVYNEEDGYIIIAGYKGNKFVTMKKVSYNEQKSPYTIEGDIDTIKVMGWESLSALKPLCEVEVIPSSEFIVE